jgi:N-acetyl-anhydromuramyl-L-alanine amidase AmpD
MSNILETLIQIPYDESQYYKATYPKTQIVLHHTASNGSAQSVADWWEAKPDRVGTPIIIDKEGQMYQLFSSRFYAGHIGDVVKEMNRFGLPERSCSKTSVGVELINLGYLIKKGNSYIDDYGHVYTGEVVHYPNKYRGFEYFAKYPQAQIDTLKELILFWGNMHNIPTKYNEDIWTVNKRALSGEPGLYCHSSFRDDKSDLHPQPEMVAMLKSL